MLKFAVFDSAPLSPAGAAGLPVPAKGFLLRHAHLLGPDDVAIPAEIGFADGYITASKRITGAAAISLQVNVPPATGSRNGGRLNLRTCLLPERAEPYLLTRELARHQVMMLLTKLEEWGLFDRGQEEPAMARVTAALEAFTTALVESQRAGGKGFTPTAEKWARAALSESLAAGEQLCLLCSRIAHQRRLAGSLTEMAGARLSAEDISDHDAKDAPSHAAHHHLGGVVLADAPAIGCAINPAAFTPELAALAQQHCDFVSMPMRWVDLEPSEGKYAYQRTDKWIEWAIRTARLPVHAGPILDTSPRCVPRWLAIWEHDYETLRDVVVEHFKAVVTRYRRTVSVWNVASGLCGVGGITLSPEQAMDLTRTCVLVVKKLQPTARVIVEIAHPWGEYTGTPRGSRTVPPMIYGELLNQMQAPVDAFGVRLQMGSGEAGRACRDLLAVSAMLDRVGALERPVAVTVLGAPSTPANVPEDALEPGVWGGSGDNASGWTAETQAAWATAVARIAATKPYVSSVCWQDLYDCPPGVAPAGEMTGGGLVSATLAAKPALAALSGLRNTLRNRQPLN